MEAVEMKLTQVGWPRMILAAALLCCACQGRSDAFAEESLGTTEGVQAALAALPDARVMDADARGIPRFIRGDLGRVDRQSLARIAPVFRLAAADLTAVSTETDSLGSQHIRYKQSKNGLEVVGGDLIVHVDAQGIIYAANGSARDGFSVSPRPSLTAAAAVDAARHDSADVSGLSADHDKLVYVRSGDTMSLAYEVEVSGFRGADPVKDLVYVDAHTGQVIERHPQFHFALNREMHDFNHATDLATLPGLLVRAEGQPATGDSTVNVNYDRLGDTWNCYKTLFNRDSFNNAGGKLISSVHWKTGYNNAGWNGTQMVYGDGDGVLFGNFALSMDVTAHELTHGVTTSTANLIYFAEPGALNESMSDVLGSACEAFRNGGVSADTWRLAEDVYTPNIAGDALRYMNDPKLDGNPLTRDYYFDFNEFDNVHRGSGIGNLAFFLVSQGGTHPRGRTTVTVPGITMAKAQQIWYRALTVYMVPMTSFASARTATVNAAVDLYGANGAEVNAVNKAWDAVGVTLNYIDSSDYYVRQLYRDVLEREPDQGGFAAWVNWLKSCNGDKTCESAVRIDLAKGMFESAENRAQNPELTPGTPGYNAAYVTQCYTSFLRRQPDAAGYAWWLNALNSSGDYRGVISGFINAAEYRNRFLPLF